MEDLQNCEEEEQEILQNVPLDAVDLVSFEVLSDHSDTIVDHGVVLDVVLRSLCYFRDPTLPQETHTFPT